MGKQKKETIQEVKYDEILQVPFTEFERTMKKIVKSKVQKKQVKK